MGRKYLSNSGEIGRIEGEKSLRKDACCGKIERSQKNGKGAFCMNRYCDLHTHSTYSDGTYTPAQIIDQAVETGLSTVALCDHNTIAGLPEFHAAAEGKPIEAVGGIELSTEYLDKDLHIVGLYIRPEHYGGITAMMEDTNRRKMECNRRLVDVLRSNGYDMDYDEMCSQHPSGQINRAHIAAVLTEKGYTESIKKAFSTLLSEENGYYVPPKRITALDAIAYLKSIGVAAILAHPFFDLTEEELDVFLPRAKEAGLAGMETLYSTFDRKERELAARIAARYDLLPSGGSDFHGLNKPDIQLGRGKGDLFVPESFAESIRKTKKCR